MQNGALRAPNQVGKSYVNPRLACTSTAPKLTVRALIFGRRNRKVCFASFLFPEHIKYFCLLPAGKIIYLLINLKYLIFTLIIASFLARDGVHCYLPTS
jgi:hypothetical protein